MSMKTLLDDAAALATADRRIDLRQVRERAEAERQSNARASRVRGGLALLAVAAVVALIAVLLPVGSLVRGEGIPAGEPAPVPAVTGLPDRWYSAPVWTPPVTRHPMTAAVMVLSATLESGSVFDRSRGDGPVLVSADAKTYATLPVWGPNDGGVTLSADGREVAWWTAPAEGEAAAQPLIIHVLTLADGHQIDGNAGLNTLPLSMTWAGSELFMVTVDADDGSAQGIHEVQPGSSIQVRSGAASTQVGADGGGHWVEGLYESPHPGSVIGDITFRNTDIAAGEIEATGGIAAPVVVVQPDALGSVTATQDPGRPSWTVHVRDVVAPAGVAEQDSIDADHPLTSAETISWVKVLGWTRAGIILLVNTSQGPGQAVHRSIRIMDPDTGQDVVAARPIGTTQTIPIAIASGLVASADPIAAQEPVFDSRDRAHITFLASRAWNLHSRLILLVGAALVAGLATMTVRRIRRRDHPSESAPPAS